MADTVDVPKALTPGQRADRAEELARVEVAARANSEVATATAEAEAKAQKERADALQAQLDEVTERVVKPVEAIGIPTVQNLKKLEDLLKETTMSDPHDPHAKPAGPKKAAGSGGMGKRIESFFSNKPAWVSFLVGIVVVLILWVFFGYHEPPTPEPAPPPPPPTLSSSSEPAVSSEAPPISSDEPSSEVSSEAPPASSEEPTPVDLSSIEHKLDDLGTKVDDQGKRLTLLANTVEANRADADAKFEEMRGILDQIQVSPRPPMVCTETCSHDFSEQPSSISDQGDPKMNKHLGAAFVAASLLLSPVTGVNTSVASDLPNGCGGNGLTKVCITTPAKADVCYIDVMVQSLGHGYPADYLTAWANGGQITDKSLRGKAKPFEGLVKIKVDCGFAYGSTGQVCFGNGQDMARNLDPNWFKVAQDNLANGEHILNADTPIWFTEN